MPSPVGHALGGLIAGWMVAGAPAVDPLSQADAWRRAARHSAPFALVAVLPDVDLLAGIHSRYTHSLGAAAIVTLAVAWFVPRDRRNRRWTFALACGCAYASHVLLDWLGSDTSPPRGIMALWPWSSDFYLSGLEWFLATDRRYWLPGFVSRNLLALWWELALLAPPAVLTYFLRRPRRGRSAAVRRKLPSS
jgi:inner membrane protein